MLLAVAFRRWCGGDLNHERASDVHVPRALVAGATYAWRILTIAGAAYVVAWLLSELLVVVVPLILSFFLAAAVNPLVDRVRRAGVPSWLATTVALLLLMTLLALLVAWLSVRVRGQFDDLGVQVRQGIDQVELWLTTGPLDLQPQRVDQLERQLTSLSASAGGMADRIVGGARQLVEVLGGAVLMLFATFFLVKDGERIGAWVTDRIAAPYRDDATVIAARATTVMRRYLVGTAGVGLADASLLAVALIVLDVPLVLPLSVVTFVGAFFPVIGAFVAGALAALVALVSGGFQTALLVILAAVVVQQIEGNVLQPLILRRAVRLHPLVTVYVVSAGLIVAGLVGAFLAVPLTAIAVEVTGYYRGRARTAERAARPEPVGQR